MALKMYATGKLSKQADETLDFEQQFGTMTSARIGEKLPILDPYTIGFECIKKDDDGTYGIGTMVYMLGDQVIYIPSFYNNGRLRTADMLVLADKQQFMPATEGIISYLKSKYDKKLGETVDKSTEGVMQGRPGAVRVRDTQTPLRKTSSLKDIDNIGPDINMLKEAIHMGKQATVRMLHAVMSDNSVFNNFLDYYGAEAMGQFKEAAEHLLIEPEVEKPIDTWYVEPFDKQAKLLTDEERQIMNTFGFLVKTAKQDFSRVLTDTEVADEFVSVVDSGKYELMTINGDINKAVILTVDNTVGNNYVSPAYVQLPVRNQVPDHFLHPSKSIARKLLIAITEGTPKGYYQEVPGNIVGRRIVDVRDTSTTQQFIEQHGEPLKDQIRLTYGDIIVTPMGEVLCINRNLPNIGNKGDCFGCVDMTIKVNDILKRITQNSSVISIPADCVVLHGIDKMLDDEVNKLREEKGDKYTFEMGEEKRAELERKFRTAYATTNDYKLILELWMTKKYNKVKIYSDGSSFTITDGKSDKVEPSNIKEATFKLVHKYGVSPKQASEMLIGTYPLDDVSNNVSRWYISKQAADGNYSRGANPHDFSNMGYREVTNMGPIAEQVSSNGILPISTMDPKKLIEVVNNAAAKGVKEVFDVSIMKVLTNTSRPDVLIGDYYSTMLKMMDKLCRMLFMAYSKEDDFRDQYGEDKYEEFLETLKNNMSDLSDLFVFVNTRSVVSDDMALGGDDNLVDGIL